MSTSKDSRRDPRAKILSLTVRYKSATVAEFVENHSYDVSRGGLFIRTSSPFPTGTLIKFEVRLAEDQNVMTGVGRVTWRREKDRGEDSPAGMGVKFIKIEDESIALLDRLVGSRPTPSSSFEEGAREQGIPLSDPPAELRGVGNKEDRISSRPPPAGEMLDQTSALLKSTIGSLSRARGAQAEPETSLEREFHELADGERVTLPTGHSTARGARSVSAQATPGAQPSSASEGGPQRSGERALVSPPHPSGTSASGELKAHTAATVSAASSAVSPAVGSAAGSPTVSPELGVQAEAASDPEQAPPSSDDSVSSAGAVAAATVERGPRSDDKRAKGKKKQKKEKKRKKKFRYASIPIPRQSLAQAMSPSGERMSLATVTTTPPRKRKTEPPAAAPNNTIWYVLGAVVLSLGIYWINRSEDDTAGEPADTSVAAPQNLPATPAVTPNAQPLPAADDSQQAKPGTALQPAEAVATAATPVDLGAGGDTGTVEETVEETASAVEGRSGANPAVKGTGDKGTNAKGPDAKGTAAQGQKPAVRPRTASPTAVHPPQTVRPTEAAAPSATPSPTAAAPHTPPAQSAAPAPAVPPAPQPQASPEPPRAQTPAPEPPAAEAPAPRPSAP